MFERCLIDRRELEAGGNASLQCCVIGIDHRVIEAAGARDDRNAAIAQAIKLGEAAGLEARWHENGIRTRLHEVRQCLVVTDDHPDAPWVAHRRLEDRVLDCRLAGSQQRKPRTRCHQRVEARREDVHALLPCEAAHHAMQQPVSGFQLEARLERPLVGNALLQCLGAVVFADQCVRSRIPHIRVDAVDDATQHMAPGPQQAVEAHAVFRRADFLGIGGAHRGDGIRRGEPTLEVAHIAVILEAVDGEGLLRQAERPEDGGRELALEGNVVHRHHALRPAEEARIDGAQRRLPVMAVHHIGAIAAVDAAGHVCGRLAQGREAPGIVRPVLAVLAEIGVARPVEEVWGVDGNDVEAMCRAAQQLRRPAEQVGISMEWRRLVERCHHRGVAGDDGRHLHALGGKCRWQCPRHVGKAAGLHQREQL